MGWPRRVDCQVGVAPNGIRPNSPPVAEFGLPTRVILDWVNAPKPVPHEMGAMTLHDRARRQSILFDTVRRAT
jgi:hypothetical protein